MTRLLGLSAALLGTCLAGLQVAPAAEAGAGDGDSTCRGRAATITADTATVTGTPGADVLIVGKHTSTVYGGAGDDLVCAVGSYDSLTISGGDGDDIVDTTGVTVGTFLNTSLGRGRDQFYGGPAAEYVTPGGLQDVAFDYSQPGEDTIDTGAGPDAVSALPGDAVDTGRGADQISAVVVAGQQSSDVEWRLGRGRDLLYVGEPYSTGSSLRVALPSHRLTLNGVTVPVRGVEEVHGVAQRVVMLGDQLDNQLESEACTTVLRGGDGDDELSLNRGSEDGPFDRCTPTSRMFGGAGADRLSGRDGGDLLLGGRGRDLAQAREGRDTCQAEVAKNCEQIKAP